MLSINRLMDNPANDTVLSLLADRGLLKLPPAPQPHKTAVQEANLWPDEEVSPFDEGGILFIHDYGHAVPPRLKFSFGLIHAFIHDGSGEIFAVHWGRLTIVVRYDGERSGLDDHEGLRRLETLDGLVDVRALGAGWALGECFGDELDVALRCAWEAAEVRAGAGGV